MGWDEIIGQEVPVKFLSRVIENDNIAGAYVFYGPEGVGKGKTAEAFTNAADGDVKWMAPARFSRSIGINDIRSIKKDSSLKSFEGRKKFYVLDEADRMTEEASNTLLKILEEPPPKVFFVLITSHVDLLLPTINSRCQKVKFSVLKRGVVKEILESRFGFDDKESEILSSLCEGSLGRAVRLKEDNIIELRKKIFSMLLGLNKEKVETVFNSAKSVVDDLDKFKTNLLKKEAEEIKKSGMTKDTAKDLIKRREGFVESKYRMRIDQILGIITSWYRDLLMVKKGSSELVVNVDMVEELEKQCSGVNISEVERKINALKYAGGCIERNANLRLVFEVLLMELTS